MEDKRTTITNGQGKRKFHPLISSLSIGGEGGIAGVFVFGGALAIAGFMAVASFANNKHNKAKTTHDHQSKPKPKPQPLLLDEHGCKREEDNDTTQSLTSLVQHSTIPHDDTTRCWTSNMSINQVSGSSELLSTQSLILEKKSEVKQTSIEESPTRIHHQEIVFSDSSHPESAASSNESRVAEECMVSLFNSPGGQAQEVEKDEEPQNDLTSSETDTETEDDDTKDDDEDDDMLSDDVSEIGEEDRAKATWTTSLSLDYSEEPVWPAELIQHAKQKFKRDGHVCTDSDVDGSDFDEAMTVANQATRNQNLNLFMVPNNQPLTWIFPFLLLGLLLLLVLLTRRPQESFYVLEEGNSVVKRI